MPLFQNESKCEIFRMKMSSACSFIFMQIKVIFKRMVLHLHSLSEAQENSEMAYSKEKNRRQRNERLGPRGNDQTSPDN